MSEMTYIVTGCTGYVGNVLAKKLLSMGERVVGLARSEKKVKRVFPDGGIEIVYGDITNAADVERLFAGGEEFTVLHTAAVVTIGEGDQNEAMRITVEGARNVVEACLRHNVKKLVQISSSEALPAEGLDSELSNYNPQPDGMKKGYARAKCAADRILLDAVKERGLHASLLMFAAVLGAGDYTNGHMNQLIADFVEGRLPASIKGGYNITDIQDVAAVLPAILENSKAGESYVFAGEKLPINDILRAASAVSGRKLPVTLPMWLAYVGLPFLSVWFKIRKKRPLYTATALRTLKRKGDFPVEKAKREFGYNPSPIEETVKNHVDFLVENAMITLPKKK